MLSARQEIAPNGANPAGAEGSKLVSMEPSEAASDLVGRTSARLLAAGVDRSERLDALHLLAILDASIDTSGRVRRPLDHLPGAFELQPLSVLRQSATPA